MNKLLTLNYGITAESSFVKPHEFIPERWTTKPDMVKDGRAFNAFGLGSSHMPILFGRIIVH